MRSKLVIIALTAILALWAGAANAGFNVMLDQPILQGVGGETLLFSGTLNNDTSQEMFLNSLSFNLSSSFLEWDDTPFWSGPVSLQTGESWNGTLFNIIIDPATTAGRFDCTLSILGGEDIDAQEEICSQNFAVEVQSAAVPEAGTLVLAIPGLSMAAVFARRIRA